MPTERRPIVVVYGTRPEMIKLAPVVVALAAPAVTIHTGQHHDGAMSTDVARALGLPSPGVHLTIGGQGRAAQLGQAVEGIAAALQEVEAAAVVVQGDTTSALAGALAGRAVDVPVAHVEAGLRSFDRAMPEEHNRVVIDHLADWCGAPTATASANLASEAIPAERVEVTGNTVVDALHALLPPLRGRRRVVAGHGLVPHRYVLATVHRPENTDDPERLRAVLDVLAASPLPVVVPLHPRTRSVAVGAGLGPVLERIRTLPPVDPITFLALQAEAAFLVTDSGGVQEEATVLGRPTLVVRRSTERPEGLGITCHMAPAEVLAPAFADMVTTHHERARALAGVPSPYGDGHAGTRTARAVERLAAGGDPAPAPVPIGGAVS